MRDLIQRHIDRTGQSQRQLALGSGVRPQTLSTWMAGDINEFPEPERIRRFAAYTGYSEQTVVLAAAATIGLRVAEVGGPAAPSTSQRSTRWNRANRGGGSRSTSW